MMKNRKTPLPTAVLFILPLAAVGTGADPDPLHAQAGAGRGEAAGEFVDSIEIVGNVRQPTHSLLGMIRIRPGTRATYVDVQRAIKNLWATQQFEDIAVRVRRGEPPDTPTILTFVVREQPLVREVVLRGLKNLSANRVKDSAAVRDPHPYSPNKMAAVAKYIREGLSKKGIPFVQIEERRTPVPGVEDEIRIVVDVTEGTRVTIVDVAVEGNQSLSDGEIEGAMKTKQEGFWWFRSGKYDREVFVADLARVTALYESRGFLEFRLLSDTLVVDPETGRARVELVVDEGPRFHLGELVIEGAEHFADEELREHYVPQGARGLLGGLGLNLGFGGGGEDGDGVFNLQAFHEGADQVAKRYRDSGYLYVTVAPSWEVLSEDEDRVTVAATWRVEEGEVFHISKINIAGNDYTHESVIRGQISLIPGSPFSQDGLIRSYQAISSLGYFKSPLPNPNVTPTDEGEVEITFEVEENQTGEVSFGTAVGGGTGVAGFIGYNQPNLFGQAKEGTLRWDFGRYINSFSLTYSDPALFQSFVSGKFSLFDSRDRFFRFRTGDRKRRGLSALFGFPLPQLDWTRLYAGYSISRTRYELRRGTDDTSLFGRPPGTQSTVSIGITRRSLNHPLFPTAGSLQKINSEFSGGPLQGDANFSKYTVEGTWWAPAGQFGNEDSPVRLAIGLTVKGGAIMGDASDFPFERFWMGGVQFGESLRGYDETSVTPRGYFPEGSTEIADIDRLGDAFFLLKAEYAVRLTNNISLSLFYDAGSTWTHVADIDPTRLYRGTGIGILLVTPFGPIGLDYAYGLDKDRPGPQLHFQIGGAGL